MATEEHKRLSDIIKNTHKALRNSSKDLGAETAWKAHVKDEETLKIYAQSMEKLSNLWEENACKENSDAISRINWITNYCLSYFITDKLIVEKRLREERLMSVHGDNSDSKNRYFDDITKVRLLDVGSCFNPFQHIDFLNVMPMDLCPSNNSVHKGDFLQLNISEEIEFSESTNELIMLPANYFDCVVFSLLLEYIPSSLQRILCCRKAYELLKFEGILIIITPDSQNVGKNAKLMKNWRYSLSKLGFSRIKFEKLSHITCLVFRKCLSPFLTNRWAEIHKENYMTFDIFTPQDSLSKDNV